MDITTTLKVNYMQITYEYSRVLTAVCSTSSNRTAITLNFEKEN